MIGAVIASLVSANLPPPADLPVAAPLRIPAREAVTRVEAGQLTTWFELDLTKLIFFFALMALTFLFLIARGGSANPFVLRIYVITILVFGSLLVVSSAYSTEQIAPVIGFFGTIAGYLLGKGDRQNEPDS
jgi:hypothetical protein